MDWLLFLILTLLVLAATVVAAASVRAGKYRRGRVLTPMNIVFGGVFLAIFLCQLPIFRSAADDLLKTVVFTLHSTIQIFTINTDHSIVEAAACCPNRLLGGAYAAILSLALIAAPFLTFGFVISFFKNACALARYLLLRRRDAYIFSALNEKSLALGADLRRNHKRAALVYTDVSGSAPDEFSERARELRAICFKKDVLSVNFRRHSPRAQLVFFAIGEEETGNVTQALKLLGQYGDAENVRLYVFSSGTAGELLLSQAGRDTAARVRRVNEIRSLIDHLLYERGEALFQTALPCPDGVRRIHAVLVGLGRYGTEMLKALSWYCQMDGYRVEIDAFEKDKLAEDRFAALAPELMDKKHNGASVPSEAEYTIRIHSGVDAETQTFADALDACRDATYVFVSLGTDERNIRVAARLRTLFARKGLHPIIQTVVLDTDAREALSGVSVFSGEPYDVEFLGDVGSTCTEAVVMNPELEAEALRRHLKWGDEDGFWRYEYNYNSSVAAAIHRRARLKCGIPGADKRAEELTEAERETVEQLEHRRWNAYMRAEGYVHGDSRDDLGKVHPDLVPFKRLTDEEKRKDSRVGTL